MEDSSSRKPVSRKRWSDKEIATMIELVPKYGNKFATYQQHIDKGYACIKGQYYTQIKKGRIQLEKNPKQQVEEMKPEAASKEAKAKDSDNVQKIVEQLLKLLKM